jgi:hypothetical protein
MHPSISELQAEVPPDLKDVVQLACCEHADFGEIFTLDQWPDAFRKRDEIFLGISPLAYCACDEAEAKDDEDWGVTRLWKQHTL